jgi:FMNH2-dependent dimethyl sulfone monooxygenase
MTQSASPTVPRRNPTLFGGNRLKFGWFGTNCSCGRVATKVPNRWDDSWESNLKLARIADEAGIECMMPIGRWRGYGGETDSQGATFETIVWVCGLLAQTRHLRSSGPSTRR